MASRKQPAARPQSSPQFADPWAFRSPRQGRLESAADLVGRPLTAQSYRRGGVPAVEYRAEIPQRPERSMLLELRRRVSAEVARYRLSGLCSAADLALIEALWCDGKSLREYARELGVTPAAVGDRIERLRERCPRFYRFWLFKNRRRREACDRRSG